MSKRLLALATCFVVSAASSLADTPKMESRLYPLPFRSFAPEHEAPLLMESIRAAVPFPEGSEMKWVGLAHRLYLRHTADGFARFEAWLKTQQFALKESNVRVDACVVAFKAEELAMAARLPVGPDSSAVVQAFRAGKGHLLGMTSVMSTPHRSVGVWHQTNRLHPRSMNDPRAYTFDQKVFGFSSSTTVNLEPGNNLGLIQVLEYSQSNELQPPQKLPTWFTHNVTTSFQVEDRRTQVALTGARTPHGACVAFLTRASTEGEFEANLWLPVHHGRLLRRTYAHLPYKSEGFGVWPDLEERVAYLEQVLLPGEIEVEEQFVHSTREWGPSVNYAVTASISNHRLLDKALGLERACEVVSVQCSLVSLPRARVEILLRAHPQVGLDAAEVLRLLEQVEGVVEHSVSLCANSGELARSGAGTEMDYPVSFRFDADTQTAVPVNFETRNTGLSVSATAKVWELQDLVTLELHATTCSGPTSWQTWGSSELGCRTPVFDEHQLQAFAICVPGEAQILGACSTPEGDRIRFWVVQVDLERTRGLVSPAGNYHSGRS